MRTFLKISLLWLIQTNFCSAQNLVINGSFEDTITCSFAYGALVYNPPGFYSNSPPWFNAQGSPDQYHQCHLIGLGVPYNDRGYQLAKSGVAYAGCILYQYNGNTREYIETRLAESLIQGKKYCVEFWVNFTNSSEIAIDGIGAYFSQDTISGTVDNLPYIPQIENPKGNVIIDTANWTLISGEFIAGGGEQFMTIGSFPPKDSLDTLQIGGIGGTYYFIDDVSVYCCDVANTTANAGKDTIICIGESTTIGTALNTNFTYSWKPAEGLTDTTAAQPMVNPAITTTYILTVTDTSKPYSCKNTATDTVTVTVIDCDTLENNAWLPNVFSPNNDNNNDVLFVRGTKVNSLQFTVYNRWGEKVFNTKSKDEGWDGTFRGKQMNPGVFVYFCRVIFEDGTERELKGNVTLVR